MYLNYILLFILIVLFFVLFFYILFTNNNKLIKFIVIKTQKNYDKNNIEENNIEENNIENKKKDKYSIKECNKICKNNFCDEYHSQIIKYDLCKECKKENKCYDYLEGKCISCKNNYTCEQLYGCNNLPPIHPINNFCTKCWL